MYALIDCNNFYVSCERLFKPNLNGRPVIVLSNNDGCVIARSNESKALGIKMGQPYFQIKELVSNCNVEVFSANLTLYGNISARVMSIIQELCYSVEIYSIDEAFANLSGLSPLQAKELGDIIVKRVKKYVGIPVSVGIAPTKTLAKVASKLCKQYPKLNGCCLMYRQEDVGKVLSKFPLNDVWGIGRRYGSFFTAMGVNTAMDFINLKEGVIRKKMGVTGLRTWEELRGIECIKLEDSPPDKKQICTSRTFSKELEDYEEIKGALVTFLSRCANKLRQQKSTCSVMRIFLSSNRFKDTEGLNNRMALIKFDTSTDSTLEMVKGLVVAFNRIYQKNIQYKRAGVILSDIVPSASVQLNLFDNVDHSKHSKLMDVIDEINFKQCKNILILASEDSNAISIGRSRLSPCYTTKWDDIIIVK